MSIQGTPQSPTITGTGRIARKTREAERSARRQRLFGVGVSTGPLGTVVTEQPQVRQGGGAGRDTWAA